MFFDKPNDERKAILDAIYLMEDVCPVKGWCLSGTGADYARRAINRLMERLAQLRMEGK